MSTIIIHEKTGFALSISVLAGFALAAPMPLQTYNVKIR